MIISNGAFHKLKYWRGILGLTQENMATLTGQTKSNYCLKENGKLEFRLGEMKIIKKTINEMLSDRNMTTQTMDEIFFD